jgi:hypothetical protein
MKYFLDTEFNGYRGELISLALAADDGRDLYLLAHRLPAAVIPWVQDNVVSVLFAEGTNPIAWRQDLFGVQIAEFIRGDESPTIIADWPDDIRYFCECLITGPGQMVETVKRLTFAVERVDAYPTTLPGAVQHNALWDARALRHAVGGAREP